MLAENVLILVKSVFETYFLTAIKNPNLACLLFFAEMFYLPHKYNTAPAVAAKSVRVLFSNSSRESLEAAV